MVIVVREKLALPPRDHTTLLPRRFPRECAGLDELKRHTRVTFKETDLFRVYQSIDLVSFFIHDPSGKKKFDGISFCDGSIRIAGR